MLACWHSEWPMGNLMVRIPDELHKKLKHYSVETGKDMAVIVAEVLTEYFAKLEQKQTKKRTD
jgi:predicted DNA-binding protein